MQQNSLNIDCIEMAVFIIFWMMVLFLVVSVVACMKTFSDLSKAKKFYDELYDDEIN